MIIRQQRLKVKDTVNLYSSWKEIVFRMPQDSALSCMILNVFLSEFFLVIEKSDFVSYADDM